MSTSFRGGLVLAAVGMWAGLAAPTTAGTLTWNFDRGDLSLSAGYQASATMDYLDEDTREATTFGATGGAAGPPDLPDGPAHFLYHPQLPNFGRSGYTIDHAGLLATSGEERITSWTMVFDLYLPADASGLCNGMFNTSPAQSNAADWFLYPDGAIGIGALHITDAGVVVPDAWHRVGLVYDAPRGKVEYWVDGAEVYDGAIQATSRYGLLPSTHAGADLVIQGDHGADSPPFNYTSELYLSSFALADFACLDYQMKQLGGAKAAGVLLPTSPVDTGRVASLSSAADLDLDGSMAYAINVGGSAAATVGDVTFAAGLDEVPGYANTMQPGAREQVPPDFGDDAATNGLETLLGSLTWQDAGQSPSGEVSLVVTPGADYKLQLLFWRPYGLASFDVSVEGVQVLDEFQPGTGIAGSLFTYLVTAEDDLLEITFEGGSDPDVASWNPTLNALTLEILSDATTPALPGDANGDGRVDDLDASVLAAHWMQTTGATLAEGDFTGDGRVDDLDASTLAANWLAGTAGTSTAPEPPGWALLAIGGLMVAILGRHPAPRGSRHTMNPI